MKMPWVILSSGVDADIFGRAVSIAMKGGASGFLAGRAVWASVVGAQDPQTMLRDVPFHACNGWLKLSMKVSRNANPLWISILENNNG